jgi:hypothetical protein
MLSSLTLFTLTGLASAWNGGCPHAKPEVHTGACSCNANPTVSKYVACGADGNPHYFNDSSDIPNGACIMYNQGNKAGVSLNEC